MKYHIKTFGCQMNVSDSERIASFLEKFGFSSTQEIKNAELVIFNTCGIKQTAENRAYSMINNLRKEKGLNIKIIMTGCLANRKDVRKRMNTKVDLFLSIKDTREFENWIIENYLEIGNWKLEIPSQKKRLMNQEQINYLSIKPKHQNKYQAYVPIMTGCNNFCAYCVVPHARGREVSRPADEIIDEVKKLIAQGYKSITLLGQNVNSYQGASEKNSEIKIDFSELLKKINAIPGNFWIYFVSSHPKDMSDKLIDAVTKYKKVCENIHLPVQAGDDEILQRMNRHYTKKQYLQIVQKIKKSFQKNKPGTLFSVSSDIIVGFPGETVKQFLESADIMKKAKFDMVFFGQFSPRPGTVAWKMQDNVPQEEKASRENTLNEILKKTTFTHNKKYLNKEVNVLIEKEKDGFYFGKTRTLKNVKLKTDRKNLIGKIVKSKIRKVNFWNLEGELLT
jgi:tRNA-2-methylthio-N6-dimethylallyladenosine synthase